MRQDKSSRALFARLPACRPPRAARRLPLPPFETGGEACTPPLSRVAAAPTRAPCNPQSMHQALPALPRAPCVFSPSSKVPSPPVCASSSLLRRRLVCRRVQQTVVNGVPINISQMIYEKMMQRSHGGPHQMRRLFKAMDKDGSWSLSHEEFGNFLESMHLHMDEDVIKVTTAVCTLIHTTRVLLSSPWAMGNGRWAMGDGQWT